MKKLIFVAVSAFCINAFADVQIEGDAQVHAVPAANNSVQLADNLSNNQASPAHVSSEYPASTAPANLGDNSLNTPADANLQVSDNTQQSSDNQNAENAAVDCSRITDMNQCSTNNQCTVQISSGGSSLQQCIARQ